MEALEKLLGLATKHYYTEEAFVRFEIDDFDNAINEVKNELSERYMALPCDADGVPIRPGDCVCGLKGENADARFVTAHCDGTYDVGSRGWQPHYLRHVKPRTVEDVLREFAYKVCDLNVADEAIDEYADKLLEAMGGDAE